MTVWRALVTGGAGFIGSNLVRALRDEGHAVVVLDSLLSGHRENLAALDGDVRLIEGDIRDPEVVASAIAGVDVVFHLAASVGNKRSIERPIEDSEINVLGTLRVLEACRAGNVRSIVYSSSAGIFGELKQLPIREDHPLEPDSPYGASKLAGEKLVLAYGKLYGLDALSLRYFNVYGPNQRFDAYGNAIPIFAHRLLQGEPVTIFGDGQQTRDFVNVADVVQANLRAARAEGLSGAFNIASGSSMSINDLVELMAELSQREPEVEHVGPRQGDVRHSLADISAARECLDYEPNVALRRGLKEYLAWCSRSLDAA
jgi:UDP-glucose 4-epimerase